MIVLFIGDIVGAEATGLVARNVSKLRRDHDIDLVIANAENCAPDGLGTTVEQLERLLDSGVNVLSGGNHSWDSAQAVASLELPGVLRPANVAADVPGRGVLTVEAAGETVTVVNLADHCALRSTRAVADKIIPAYQAWVQVEKCGTVIVDYHGDHVLEKQIFAHAVDGSAAAVFGSHTHEPTMPLHLLPGGTAFITDVGMTGPVGGVQGFDPVPLVRNLRERGDAFDGPLPGPLREVPITFGAVLVTIEVGKATKIERLTDASLTG
jgi:metallophosphoesterase (TIGR00282 family)